MASCYICYEREISSNKFVSNPCQCKGTNKIHQSCLQELIRNNGSTCTICKSEFNRSEKKIDTNKEKDKSYRIDSIRYPSKTTYKSIESVDHYDYQEAPRIDSIFHPSRPTHNYQNENRYYRDKNIEIRAIDLGNGNFEIRYAPKHDCCCIIC